MFTWHRGDFAPGRVFSGSLSWLYICLHDTTTKCHAGASHPRLSWPRFLYRGENFTPIQNLGAVSCKRPPVSVWSRSAGRLERVAHAQCLRFWITRVFYQHEVHFQITRYEPSHHVNAFRNQKVIPVWNSRRCEFSEHPLILNILFVIDCGDTPFFFFLFFIMKRHLEEIFFGGENVTM